MLRRSIAIALAAALVAGACGGSDGKSRGEGGPTLVVAQSFEPATLDPALSNNVITYNLVRPVMETLVTVERGGTEVVPLLATSWEVSPDGRSWLFRLRDDVRFHDGTPFDAAAVCANFERWYRFSGILQRLASSWNEFFGRFAGQHGAGPPGESLYQSCEARAEHEVVVNLTRKAGGLLPALAVPAFGIASPTALRRYEADKVSGTADSPRFEGSYGSAHLVGTGPLRLERWDRSDKVVLARNRDYWGPKSQLDRVIIRRIDDRAARRQALQSGEIDGYWPVAAADIAALERDRFRVHELPNFTLGYLNFNLTRPPLDNLQIRRAVAHALDRETLVRAKYPPSAMVASEVVPPNLWGHAPDVTVYRHDPQLARQLIAESGVAQPKVELWYPTGFTDGTPPLPDPEGIALSLKADLEEAGFSVIAKPALWAPDFFEAVSSGKVQMFLDELFAFRVDPDALFDQFARRYETGTFGPLDADLRAVLDAAADEIDQAERARQYEQANRIVADRVLLVPFVHAQAALAYSREVVGYQPGPIFWEGLFDVRLD
ncbi:MAG: ABC transporter substrate-binding protein [Actinomycetota bacterium]|nr:ABC transporter substrate-binding protein [Actinomycetota bacterium]